MIELPSQHKIDIHEHEHERNKMIWIYEDNYLNHDSYHDSEDDTIDTKTRGYDFSILGDYEFEIR